MAEYQEYYLNTHAAVIISRNRGCSQSDLFLENELAELCSKKSDLDVIFVPHLYDLPDDSDVWETLRSINGRLLFVTWIYPRPVSIILAKHLISTEPDSILDFRDFQTASECHQAIINRLAPECEAAINVGSINEIDQTASERWYPVIDSSLCVNCGNCLQFCIFNVYTYDESHHVTATNPDNCKTGCPACSRICPHGAIIFPLYSKDAAISGAPGLLMSPDAAARRMFYKRTKKTCPACNQTADDARISNQNSASKICDECGCPIDTLSELQPDQDAANDIDLLIDDLDNITRRRS